MIPTPPETLPPLERLRQIMALLRGPGGCPWDHEQTHATLRGALLEEAYEVATAIDTADDVNLREELGDLLLQVYFHSQIATEEGRFTVDEVARGISEKLVRRHPHVFGDERAASAGAVLTRWDEIKRQEKGGAAPASHLDGVTGGLPALLHAEKVQKKAAKAGFDWAEAAPVLAKIREELAELEQAMAGGAPAAIEDELGDVLFSVVNLGRHLRVEPEVALRAATEKFIRRFQAMERLVQARALVWPDLSFEELDLLWAKVKAER